MTFAGSLQRFVSLMRPVEPKKLSKPIRRPRDWRPSLWRIELEITTDCNLRCRNCDRSSRQAPSRECMSPQQVELFCRQSESLEWDWLTIVLLGGEPTQHPHLEEILKIMQDYHSRHARCEVVLATNGYGPAVEQALTRLPEWLTVRNSGKTTPVQSFSTYNVAPMDLPLYAEGNFGRGCWVTEQMGMGLTRYGYYACGAAASVDRVFGFDMGIKHLADVTMPALKQQMATLCGLCGHFKRNDNQSRTKEEVFSPSWQQAYSRYKIARPELMLYRDVNS